MTHVQQFLEMKGEEKALMKIFKSTIVTRLIMMRSQPNCFEVVIVVVDVVVVVVVVFIVVVVLNVDVVAQLF